MRTLLPRHMYPKDFPTVERIDRASFEVALDKSWLERNYCYGVVSRVFQFDVPVVGSLFSEVVGFYIYERYDFGIRLLRFAVDPEHRRRGVGAKMFQTLLESLAPGEVLNVHVPETNLAAQLFLQKRGMRAVFTDRGAYAPMGEDVYIFTSSAAGERRRVAI